MPCQSDLRGIYGFDKDLIVLALSGGELARAAKDMGMRVAQEVLQIGRTREDGTLVNRRKEGAMITDEEEAISRVIRMIKEKKVTAVTGNDISIEADSVCVHGDGQKRWLLWNGSARLFKKRAL